MTYKRAAIENYADAILEFMEPKTLTATGEKLIDLKERVGIVPAPPSMAPGNPEFDDRNVQTCRIVCARTGFKLCRDIEVTEDIGQSHAQGTRDPERIRASLGRIAHNSDNCELVFVVDDVLVSGAHFAAIKSLLGDTGCRAQIFGLFYAKSESQVP